MEEKSKSNGQTFLRIALAILFIVPGLSKLKNPDIIVGMLSGLGFPIPSVLGWVVLLSEILFGLALLVGWKVRVTVWPLFIILLVAALFVVIPALDTSNLGTIVSLLWHLVGLAGLYSIYKTGPGSLTYN